MSLASRPTTRAEEQILLQNGFYKSNLESTGDTCVVEGEERYTGVWHHKEIPSTSGVFGPDEALEILRRRQAEFAGTTPDDA
jgi:hypothetical protein